MSMDGLYPKWRYAEDLPIFRTMGGPKRVQIREAGVVVRELIGPEQVTWSTPFRAWAGTDYTDRIFSLDVFTIDGYGDVTCPCGEVLSADNAGDQLREIYKHCGASGHPLPRFDR